ncbi:DUF4097 family beta strand repeat-containing protein [Flammeovirga sp. SubArs3]|uniref:DUF4097 family beta strand repeat-containing protein n=1 Tax=Flammeovirga sp. SubArs3 TaxID=2995316 RepID=UPI00248C7D6F|nr:DUF4097 family beta strand repeat-containing protein [Flammeovirga sp. SubArs3]
MKTLRNIIFNLIFLMVVHQVADAQHPNLVSKTFERSYSNVNSNTLLEISNAFGNVVIETRDGISQVDVKVTMEAWNTSANKAQSTLESISIEDNSSDGHINLSTITPSSSNNNSKKGFKITYNVLAPSDIRTELYNKYGGIITDDLKGDSHLKVAYGNLTAKDLSSQNNHIEISYGSGEIDFIEKGSIRTRYLGSLQIGQANDVEIDDKYGNIQIGTAGTIVGESDYSTLSIGQLKDALSYDIDYGTLKVEGVTKEFTDISASSSYGSIKIAFEDDAPFNFDANTRYGSFKSNIDGLTITTQIEKNTSSEFSGYHLKKNTGKNVSVKSSYGSIKFN